MRVMVRFRGPAVVIHSLVGVPNMVVGVVRVVHPITHSNRTSSECQRRQKRRWHSHRTQQFTHCLSPRLFGASGYERYFL